MLAEPAALLLQAQKFNRAYQPQQALPLSEVIPLLRLAQLYQRSGQERKSEPLYVKVFSLREKS